MAERPEQSGIARAVEHIGSQRGLASALGVTQQAVSEWVAQGWVPKDRVHDILDLVDPSGTALRARDLLNPAIVAILTRR